MAASSFEFCRLTEYRQKFAPPNGAEAVVPAPCQSPQTGVLHVVTDVLPGGVAGAGATAGVCGGGDAGGRAGGPAAAPGDAGCPMPLAGGCRKTEIAPAVAATATTNPAAINSHCPNGREADFGAANCAGRSAALFVRVKVSAIGRCFEAPQSIRQVA